MLSPTHSGPCSFAALTPSAAVDIASQYCAQAPARSNSCLAIAPRQLSTPTIYWATCRLLARGRTPFTCPVKLFLHHQLICETAGPSLAWHLGGRRFQVSGHFLLLLTHLQPRHLRGILNGSLPSTCGLLSYEACNRSYPTHGFQAAGTTAPPINLHNLGFCLQDPILTIPCTR